jgi:hypothetical protein
MNDAMKLLFWESEENEIRFCCPWLDWKLGWLGE